MRTLREYGLKEAQLAAEFLEDEISQSTHGFNVADQAWDRMLHRRSVAEIAQLHLPLERHAAAAYGLHDRELFARSCSTFLKYGVSRVVDLDPGRALLAYDVGYAVCRGMQPEARAAATALLGSAAEDAQIARDDPVAYQGTVLAHLLDLDYARADSEASALATACETGKFSKHESKIISGWAVLAIHIARRVPFEAALIIADIEKEMRRHVDAQLRRWRRGVSIESLAEDFWNWPLTALLAIANDFGMDAGEPVATADFRWTRMAC